ncbi:12152_t:CDS:2 [Acaulospora colombiana]|uniref:12152_t:CDS:1 n=1 Tax=Acaulospora colombiana TaxID=27376 RepID=A0ACA9LNL7_9GLOM|nr:12152_t:CDS:2 [Acaulospora colombiana]
MEALEKMGDDTPYHCPACPPGGVNSVDGFVKQEDEEARLKQNECAAADCRIQEAYLIERLVGRKPCAEQPGQFAWLVKWDGYGIEQCTWKPTWTFDSASLIREFHASAVKEGIGMDVLLEPVTKGDQSSGVILLQEALEFAGVQGATKWNDDFARVKPCAVSLSRGLSGTSTVSDELPTQGPERDREWTRPAADSAAEQEIRRSTADDDDIQDCYQPGYSLELTRVVRVLARGHFNVEFENCLMNEWTGRGLKGSAINLRGQGHSLTEQQKHIKTLVHSSSFSPTPSVALELSYTDAPAANDTVYTADDGTKFVYNAGDIAWTLASTALVWLMIPGVGYLYSGLLRRKNALNQLWLAMVTIAVVSFQGANSLEISNTPPSSASSRNPAWAQPASPPSYSASTNSCSPPSPP